MPIKLVIFDLDGTLVDTRADISNSLNVALRPLGLPPLSLQETTALIGEGLTRLVEKALGVDRAPHRDEVLRRFLEHYSVHLADNSYPYPGVSDVLESLAGVRKAVLSNKREALSKKLLEELALDKYFDLIAGIDTTPEKKPSPGAVSYVLRSLGAEPHDAVMVGDSRYDIQAGKNAGVKTVAVSYGYAGRDDLSGADHIIDNLYELLPLLYDQSALTERRREMRHDIPAIYQNYIEFTVKIADEFSPADVINLSEHGVKFKSPVPFDPGTSRHCTISVPRSLQRVIDLVIGIRHCKETDDSFVIGAEIEEVGSEMWFKIFKYILQFITERKGNIF